MFVKVQDLCKRKSIFSVAIIVGDFFLGNPGKDSSQVEEDIGKRMKRNKVHLQFAFQALQFPPIFTNMALVFKSSNLNRIPLI